MLILPFDVHHVLSSLLTSRPAATLPSPPLGRFGPRARALSAPDTLPTSRAGVMLGRSRPPAPPTAVPARRGRARALTYTFEVLRRRLRQRWNEYSIRIRASEAIAFFDARIAQITDGGVLQHCKARRELGT